MKFISMALITLGNFIPSQKALADTDVVRFNRQTKGIAICQVIRESALNSQGTGVKVIVQDQGEFFYQWPLADNHASIPWHEIAGSVKPSDEPVFDKGYTVASFAVNADKWLDHQGAEIRSMEKLLAKLKRSSAKNSRLCAIVSLRADSMPFFDGKSFKLLEAETEGRLLFISPGSKRKK